MAVNTCRRWLPCFAELTFRVVAMSPAADHITMNELDDEKCLRKASFETRTMCYVETYETS